MTIHQKETKTFTAGKKYCYNANVTYYIHSEDILPYLLFSMKEDDEIKIWKYKQNPTK